MKIFLHTMRIASTLYCSVVWFAFCTLLSSRKKFGLCLPANPEACAFQNAVRPRLEHSIANIHESCTFAALQNVLLPKSVSGKLQPPPLITKHQGALHQQIKVKDIL